MTANVFEYAGKKPAWHGEGHVNPMGWPNVTAAFNTAGMNYEFKLVKPEVVAFGKRIPAGGQRVIVRGPTRSDPNPVVIGQATEQYQIVQPMTFASIIDPLCENFPVQTVRALGKGEKLWVCLAYGETAFKGDDYQEFIFAHDDLTGGAMRFMYTLVRVVCMNTWIMAMSKAREMVSIPHVGDPAEVLKWRVALEQQLAQAKAEARRQFEALAAIKLGEKDVERVLKAAYRTPPKPLSIRRMDAAGKIGRDGQDPVFVVMREKANEDLEAWKRQLEMNERHKAEAVQMYHTFGEDMPKFAETGYALVNAVVEQNDWGKVGRTTKTRGTVGLWGYRAARKQRAIRATLALAKEASE